MMTPAADRAARDMLAQALHLKALHADPLVVPMGRGRAREKLFAIAERFEAELARPISEVIKPYSRWNDGVVR